MCDYLSILSSYHSNMCALNHTHIGEKTGGIIGKAFKKGFLFNYELNEVATQAYEAYILNIGKNSNLGQYCSEASNKLHIIQNIVQGILLMCTFRQEPDQPVKLVPL